MARPCTIASFLCSIATLHGGRVPLLAFDPRDLAKRYREAREEAARTSPRRASWERVDKLVEGFSRGGLPYSIFGDLVGMLLQAHVDGCHPARLLNFLLNLHDAHVMIKNQLTPQGWIDEGAQDSWACSRCGNCCSQHASGPISTSPVDLMEWAILGRDDVLHFTELGWPEGVQELLSRPFPQCPFLRYESDHVAFCLIHPVRPRECRAFRCQG